MNGTDLLFDFKSAKKAFSRISLGIMAFFAATLFSQIILLTVFEIFVPTVSTDNYTVMMIFSSVTMYLIGFPVFYLVVRPIKKQEITKTRISIPYIGAAFLIAMFFMQAGQMLGNAVYLSLYDWLGIDLASTSLEIINNITWYEALIFAVIIGPFFEELIFRKVILDRVSVFGEKTAMVFSALLFAFFHMSVQQFFYAFLVGLLFSYIYIRTKNIFACYILHAIINFFGSVLPLLMFELVDMDALMELMASETPDELIKFIEENIIGYSLVAAYSLGTVALGIAGMVIFFIMRRKIFFGIAPLEIPKGNEASVAFTNFGTALFILFSVVYPLIEMYLSKM